MSGTTEAFARVKIDALLRDAGWNPTDGTSVLVEHILPDGTQADYALRCTTAKARRNACLRHGIRNRFPIAQN